MDRSRAGGPELRVELLSIIGEALVTHQDAVRAERSLSQAVEEAALGLGADHPLSVRARVLLLSVCHFRGKTGRALEELELLLPTLQADPQAFAEELVMALHSQTRLEIDEGRYGQPGTGCAL